MSIIELIKNEVKRIGECNTDVYIEPAIPPIKLKNVIEAFNLKNEWKDIIAIYDNTFFGSADKGFVFTDKKLIFRKMFGISKSFYYKDLDYIRYEKKTIINKNKKKKIKNYIFFVFTSGESYQLEEHFLGSFNYFEFELFVNKIISEVKKEKKIIENKKLELLEKEKFLQEKESHLDKLIQEKFFQKLKEYEHKIKKLEKENRILKEQLGYYE